MTTVTLEPARIVETLEKLEARIEARFPGAGLTALCRTLTEYARRSADEADAIAAPYWGLRTLILAVIAGSAAGFFLVFRSLNWTAESHDLIALVSGLDSVLNILFVTGLAIVTLVTLEGRLRRHRALGAIHKFRALVHVIDMHQLTKDPGMLAGGPTTSASPKRTMTPFELSRYLDYCSEMLSLTAKVVALYAIASTDAGVATAVNEIERLTANLSQKIWQKIMIIEASARRLAD